MQRYKKLKIVINQNPKPAITNELQELFSRGTFHIFVIQLPKQYMMNKLVFILSIILISTVSCKKKGCTAENAANYNAEAKKDDGSCVYEANASFWFDPGVSGFLVGAYDVTELTVYIDDVSVGKMDPADSKIGPDCNGENFTIVVDLGTVPKKNFGYSVRDNFGTEQFVGSVLLEGNECKSVELKW